jgi:hypothetical protein
MECGGSYLQHFSLEKDAPYGRELLMAILEPVLGTEIDFRTFVTGVNVYVHSRRWMEGGVSRGENVVRFLAEVTKDWKKKDHLNEVRN